jgi:hypothetical protein
MPALDQVKQPAEAAPSQDRCTFDVGKFGPTADSLASARQGSLNSAEQTLCAQFGTPTINFGADRADSSPSVGSEQTQGKNDSKSGADKAPGSEQIQQVFGPEAQADRAKFGPYNWHVPSSVSMSEMAPMSETGAPPAPEMSGKLQQINADPSRHVGLPEGEMKGSVYVNQGDAATAPLNVPLHTADLETCGALVVVDQKNGKQYLSHIDTSIGADRIRQSLTGLDLNDPNTRVYFLAGRTESTVPQQVVQALQGTAAADNFKLVDWNGGPERRGIAVNNGQIMRGSNRIGQHFD